MCRHVLSIVSSRVGKTKDHRIVAQQSYSPLFWDSFLNLEHKVLFVLLCWNKLPGNFRFELQNVWSLTTFIHDETGKWNNNWIVQNQTAMFIISKRKPQSLKLGTGSNNQNGNLRWHLPLGVRPPPLNGTNFQTFFTPLFFFCNWILHIWNGFYT